MKRFLCITTFLVSTLLGLSALAQNEPAHPGLDTLALTNVDDTKIRLGDYKDSPAVALVFTNNHCVYSKKYEDRLVELIAEYKERGVSFLLVNSNSPTLSSDDRLELMKERHQEKAYPCPYVKDHGAHLARALGATKNPEVYVGKWKEGQFRVVYSGKIDDNPLMVTRVENHYLRNALDHLLSGKTEAMDCVPAVGCGIKME